MVCSKFEPAPAVDVYPHRDIGGSHDDGVGDTTNLYVGNLPPTITEDALRVDHPPHLLTLCSWDMPDDL